MLHGHVDVGCGLGAAQHGRSAGKGGRVEERHSAHQAACKHHGLERTLLVLLPIGEEVLDLRGRKASVGQDALARLRVEGHLLHLVDVG